MKHTISLLFILALGIFFSTCKKDSDNKQRVALEYRIEPRVDRLYRATYTDASGADAITIDGEGEFPGGSMKLNVKAPFAAKLKAEIENAAPTIKYFTLSILVDGEVRAVKQMQVAALSPGVATVEYMIE